MNKADPIHGFRAGNQQILARAAGQRVIFFIANQRIIATGAMKAIGIAIANQVIIESTSDNAFNFDKDIIAFRAHCELRGG